MSYMYQLTQILIYKLICYQHCYHVKMNSIAISIPTSNENLVGKISIIFLARNQNQLWNGIIQRRIVAIYLIRVQSLFCHVLMMMYVPCMGSLTSLWTPMSDFLLVCWLLAPKFYHKVGKLHFHAPIGGLLLPFMYTCAFTHFTFHSLRVYDLDFTYCYLLFRLYFPQLYDKLVVLWICLSHTYFIFY